MKIAAAVFQPEEIVMMRAALDEAASDLPRELQTSSYKAALAERILLHVANGERDRRKIKTAALVEVMSESINIHDISPARRVV